MLLDHWGKELERFESSRKDVYFLEEYCKLYEDESRRAVAFVAAIGSERLVFPVMLGEIPGETERYDFETPYGYGGPIATTDDPAFWAAALSSLMDQMRDEGIVCGFIRYHPLLRNDLHAASAIPASRDRLTVSVDLKQDDEEIWRTQIHSKNRNAIRKAVSSGLEFSVETGPGMIDDFFRIYTGTMDRLGASSFYRFSRTYFENICSSLAGKYFWGVVRAAGKAVAAAVFLQDGPWGHYHLSGSLPEARALCASNLLVYEGLMELKRRGAETAHLGGGTSSSEDDSLLAFKRRFSPKSQWFCIGRLVLDHDLYGRLCDEWERRNPDKKEAYERFLLRYRM